MAILRLGLPSGGSHPRYSAHLNSDLFGGLSTSGALPESPVADSMLHSLADVASVSEVTPDLGSSGASGLSGVVTFTRSCACCRRYDPWGFADTTPNAIRGDVLSKSGPDAYSVDASAFADTSLGRDVVANLLTGVLVTTSSPSGFLAPGVDPERQVVVRATVVDRG